MKAREKDLFRALCSYKTAKIDDALIKYASPSVLGELFFNRMAGVAFDTLQKTGVVHKVNREFQNSLKSIYEYNIERNKSFIKCIDYLKCVLACCDSEYAMLKGAVLCSLYPKGYRTSNDIDLLVMPENVTQIGETLRSAGFEQGKIKNDSFVPATRKEVIESKMTRGECIPYIKQIDLPYMKYLEVDVNFSLDYKTGNIPVMEKMFEAMHSKKIGKGEVYTLCDADFFIHLSSHLYKEATTLPWIKMKRDMSLYKFFDIYMLLSKMSDEDVRHLFNRACKLGLEEVCSYAVITSAAFFDIDRNIAVKFAADVLKDSPDFIHTVISPDNNKKYIYKNKDVFERLFLNNRLNNLEEV